MMTKLTYDKGLQDEVMKRVLGTALPLCSIAAFLLGLFFYWMEPGAFTRSYTQFIFSAVFMASYFIFRKYGTRLAVHLLVLYVTGALVSEMYFNGGMRAPLYTGSMAILTFVAWYYGWRWALSYWVMLLALGGAFLVLYRMGMLPPSEMPPREAHFVTIVSQFTFVLISCAIPASMLHRELARRKQKEEDNDRLIAQLRHIGPLLLQREAESRQAQRMAKLGYWSRNLDTEEIEWSDEMFEILGIERQKPTMELTLKHIHPEDADTLLGQHLSENGQEHSMEFRCYRADGELRWISDKWWSEFDADGHEITRRGISQDITDLKRNEQLIEMQANLARTLLETEDLDSVLAVCIQSAISASGMDCGGIYIEKENGVLYLAYSQGLSPAFVEANRYIPLEHPGLFLLRQGCPIYTQHCQLSPNMNEASRAEDLKGIAVIPILHHDRLIGNLNIASHTLNEIPEVARRLLEIIANQTGGAIVRAKARAALEKSEAHFRQMVETLHDSIWETDADGRLVYVSPNAPQELGYSRDEAISKSLLELIDEKSMETLAQAMETAAKTKIGARNVLLPWRHKDGSTRWLETNADVILDAAGNVAGFRGSNRDVTERILAEQAREELEKQYRQAQKMEAVGQLAGGIAHDFNNLLQVIMGAGELLKDDVPAGNKSRQILDTMLSASDRAARLVEQLLAYSRKKIMRVQRLELNDAVSGLLKMVRHVIGADIRLTWEPSNEEVCVLADRAMIDQVLMNLCVNARDAMPRGGELHISTRLERFDEVYCQTQTWAKPGAYVALQVADTGCGIPPETMQRIFEPFFTTKEVGKGTGLGLATAYGIVRQHDGMIVPHSVVGQGTAFDIYLPLAEEALQAESMPLPAATALPGGSETILVAEDHQAVRELAALFLRKAGYQVIEACDGREAIALLAERGESIQLVVTDVVMPDLGGRDIYDYLRENHPEMPVIFATGYTEGGVHTNFVLEEGLTLLNKPFERTILLQTARDMLDKRQ